MFMYLRYWGLPAHVLQGGGGEACCACGSLLKEQNHTFRVLPQFDYQVFQLPAHLVYRMWTHTHKLRITWTLFYNCSVWHSVNIFLTTVCWLTWITSSPAWIFLVKSAGDWRKIIHRKGQRSETRDYRTTWDTSCFQNKCHGDLHQPPRYDHKLYPRLCCSVSVMIQH